MKWLKWLIRVWKARDKITQLIADIRQVTEDNRITAEEARVVTLGLLDLVDELELFAK